MISNHVTYFILFHWSDIVFFFFLLFVFIFIEVVIGIPECFLACVNSSSKFLMDYVGVYFILFYLWGGCLFVGVLGDLCSHSLLSIPSLAVPELSFQWRASILSRPCPAFSGLTRACLDVLPCAPCSAAQYFSGFNCFVAGRWKQAEGVAAI